MQRRGYCGCDFGYDSGVLGETFPVEGSQIFSYLDDQDPCRTNVTDILRKRKQMVWMDEIPETPDVDAGFENSEWKEALNSLSENFRLVVMLYYIEGFKTSEISQILDIPEGTVRSRLARGREQLAGLLQLKVVN